MAGTVEEVDGWLVACSYLGDKVTEFLSAQPEYTLDDPQEDWTVTVTLRCETDSGKQRTSTLTVPMKDMVRFCNGILGGIQADQAACLMAAPATDTPGEE